jgi:RNA polymerase sigma-70 factor (ECF subfamily)
MLVSAAEDARITRLALAAKAGDRRAAAEFVEATHAHVYRFVAHLISVAEAEDLTQETYLRAMRALTRFEGRASGRTWLLAIARHTAADHIRAAVSRPRTATLADWHAAADAAQLRTGTRFEDGVLLSRLLDELAPDRREAFVATQVLGLSYAEAAEVCGCPIGTIRSRVSRAREDLAAALHDRQPGRPDSEPGRDSDGPGRHLRAIG